MRVPTCNACDTDVHELKNTEKCFKTATENSDKYPHATLAQASDHCIFVLDSEEKNEQK